MLPFLSAKREAGWLALVVEGARIDLAYVVRPAGKRPEVLRLESFSLDGDLRTTLQRLRSARKLPNAGCTTLLAPGQYQISQFDAPPVPEDELAAALRWRFKELVDFPIEDASIGVLNIPFDASLNRQPMAHAVAASRQVLLPVVESFDAARVSLTAIDIPEIAQRNVAALFEEENRGLAFLYFNESGGVLTITYRGELYAIRRMEISASQLESGDAERRAQLLERSMLELQRTLDNFDRQYSFISVSGLRVASHPAIPDLVPFLSQNLYVPVKAMDLGEVCDFPAVPELRDTARQAQCLLAIGAALRTPDVA